MAHLTVLEQGEHLARRNDILVARGEQLESAGQIDQLTAFTGKDGKTRPGGNGLNQLGKLPS